MQSNFSRVLTLLRKEKGLSQKEAAASLGVSQALLSHYEKGIRECGLEFVVRAANYYNVSADYLLGRSADPDGITLAVEDIPEPDSAGRENSVSAAGVLPVLNKKLIANSLNILFDMLAKSGSRELTKNVSRYIMTAVYRMFRLVYSFGEKNNMAIFSVSEPVAMNFAEASMKTGEALARQTGLDPNFDRASLSLSSETLSRNYPLFASSLFSLIKNSEDLMEK